MAKYSSRSTSPGYFIALKRKLPAGRVCLPKMAALCTTERRSLSKSGRKRSSNKARSLQREHVCLHPTFMQSVEVIGIAFNWKMEAGSVSHPGLKPKMSFSSKCFTFWATSSYFSSLPPWTTIRNTLLELLHRLTGNTDIDTEQVPAWKCPRFRKTWGGPGFHVLSESFLIWQLYIFWANAGKKFGDKRPPTSRYKTLPASLTTSSALCATGKQLGRTNSSWTSRSNIRCFSSKICRISSCWLSSGNSLRLQAQIPPAQRTLHNSPCSKVKLKEENKSITATRETCGQNAIKLPQLAQTNDAMGTTPTTPAHTSPIHTCANLRLSVHQSFAGALRKGSSKTASIMLSQAGVKESNGTNFYMKRTTHLNSMARPFLSSGGRFLALYQCLSKGQRDAASVLTAA